MDQTLLQKQIRDNAEDLRSYLLDLKSWESEMKRKEEEMQSADCGNQSHPPVRSKIKKLSKGQKKSGNETEKSAKISGSDYASWDKFDVDKACEDLDNDEGKDSENYEELFTEIEEERRREEAVYEKERGNDLVKKQKWKEAIPCYSRAIKCYPHDAIFYANRALCFLKVKEYKSAEADCTTALQLDCNYVKAYQRRAAARVELGQLFEAQADLLKVMEIEPKNMVSKAELEKLKKKIKSGGKVLHKHSISAVATRTQGELENSKESNCKTEKPLDEKEIKESSVKTKGEMENEPQPSSSKEDVTDTNLENKAIPSSANNEVLEEKHDISRLADNNFQEQLWPTNDALRLIMPIQKPPHLRSKKPLKRIAIQEIENSSALEEESISKLSNISTEKSSKIEQKSDTNSVKEQEETINIPHIETVSVESQSTVTSCQPVTEDTINDVPPAPNTSVQFYVGWKKVKSNPQLRYLYFKRIPGSDLARLFGDSLESSTFSDIISTLETHFIQSKEKLLSYMIGFTKVRRFTALVMFLSQADKSGVKKILDYCKEQGECSQDEFTDLLRLYEL